MALFELDGGDQCLGDRRCFAEKLEEVAAGDFGARVADLLAYLGVLHGVERLRIGHELERVHYKLVVEAAVDVFAVSVLVGEGQPAAVLVGGLGEALCLFQIERAVFVVHGEAGAENEGQAKAENYLPAHEMSFAIIFSVGRPIMRTEPQFYNSMELFLIVVG